MAGLVALVCPRTGSRSTLFALRMDWWRSTGTSLRTRSPGKSQPAAFQCSAGRFPPDDLPRGICAKPSHQRDPRFGKPKTHSARFSDVEEYTTTRRTTETGNLKPHALPNE